jgi:hypothetical protein
MLASVSVAKSSIRNLLSGEELRRSSITIFTLFRDSTVLVSIEMQKVGGRTV